MTKILHGEPNVYELKDLSTDSCTLKDHSHSPLVCTVRCISVAGIITTVINGAQKAIVKGAQVSSSRLYTMWREIATTIDTITEYCGFIVGWKMISLVMDSVNMNKLVYLRL